MTGQSDGKHMVDEDSSTWIASKETKVIQLCIIHGQIDSQAERRGETMAPIF